MAHTQLNRITDIDRIKSNKAASTRVVTAFNELAVAVDALEAGTTSTVVTVHPVRSATTANVANLAAFTVSNDGVTLVAGDRVLLKDQSAPAANGIYVVGTVATGTAPLTRATDFDAAAEVKPNSIVAVSAGTANANTYWQLAVTAAPTIGSTSLTFVQMFTATELASTAASKGASLIGVRDAGTIYTGATVEACLAEVKALADAAIGAAKKTVNVVETSLSGASQAVNIGTALPANAIVFAHEIVVNTQGVLAGNDLSIIIGGTDTDAIVASTDLDALAPGKYQGTLGVHPRGSFASEQLVATFAASDLATLSAGDWTINVWYFVLA